MSSIFLHLGSNLKETDYNRRIEFAASVAMKYQVDFWGISYGRHDLHYLKIGGVGSNWTAGWSQRWVFEQSAHSLQTVIEILSWAEAVLKVDAFDHNGRSFTNAYTDDGVVFVRWETTGL